MTNPREDLSAQAKEAKAKSILEKNKAKGLINIEDTNALVASLSEKYGDKVYDIVLAAITRPYDMVNKMGIKDDLGDGKLTSAKLLQHIANNNIDEETLNKGLGRTTQNPQTRAQQPQTEYLDVQGTFQTNAMSYFKTENVPVSFVASPFGFNQASVENWAKNTLHIEPTSNNPSNFGDNPLAATYLNQLGVTGVMNPPNSGNLNDMTYSLKDLKNAAHLTDADITKILGADAVAKANDDNVRVTRKAALYLTETNILRQYHEANPLTQFNSRGISR